MINAIATTAAQLVINGLFSAAPFKRAESKPVVKLIEEQEIEIQFNSGKRISFVAVAEITIEKAYVISAAKNRALSDNENRELENVYVPIDLFIGWGVMSSPFSSRMFDIEKEYLQDGSRNIIYSADKYKMKRADGHCANVHLVNTGLELPARGDCIKLKGYLVDVYIDGVCTWPTDTRIGDSACETIYPTSFEVIK